jgi:FkbM family methyltransferase
MKYYSQYGEDKFVYDNFICKHREDGVFLELGATDGFKFSNTKFFEDELSFSGILIEPHRDAYDELVKNRSNCHNFNCAISSKSGNVDMLTHRVGGRGEPLSLTWFTNGMVDTMAESFKNRWFRRRRKNKIISVPSRKLSEIFEEVGVEYIDYFSLDVEGGEYEVLKTMNWNIPVYVITIELDGHNTEKDENCRNLLRENNYDFFGLVHKGNEVWYNKTYYRKNLLR